MGKDVNTQDKKLLKLNSNFGLTYFVISIWAIIALILLIIFDTTSSSLGFAIAILSVGGAYCLTLLVCECVRSGLKKNEEAPAPAPVAAPAPATTSEVLYTLTEGLSKIVVCDFLSSNYNFVESVHRPDYSRPGRGQTRGLLLPDTHYIIDKHDRKCFMYVYENDQKEVSVLIKTTKEHFAKIKAAHASAEESNFPKVTKGNKYYKLVIDKSYTREQLFEIIAEALKNIAEFDDEVVIAPAPAKAVEEPVSKVAVCKHLESFGKTIKSNHRPNFTQPGRGQTRGLPLADTHYILKGKEKICFMYVYEDEDKNVEILLKTTPEHFEKIKAAHKGVEPSNFPKVSQGNIFYSLPATKGFKLSELNAVIDEAIANLSK